MNKVEQIITEKFIEALENGCVPWQKPWKGGSCPKNIVTKKTYRGINLFLLSLMPYSSPYWMTFKQAKDKGGQVRKGEKSTLVVFWTMFKREDKKTGDEKTIPMLRYYRVFNLEQVDGIDAPEDESFQPLDFQPLAEAESMISNYCERESLEIKFEQSRAFYSPSLDYVNMPSKESFISEDYYYSVCFHELAHSTGHSSRLNRLEPASFGSDPYGKEELIAELASAFVCADLGIDNTFENSAAYLNSWIKTLKGDPKMLISASSKAKKAFDCLKGEEVLVEA
jgi:antirestriction protein ArdC